MRTPRAVHCAPLVCREFHAQPNFSHSCAGTDRAEADFGVARATYEARSVKIERVARRIECAAGGAKRM
jgi:hypothetical protein